MVERQDRLLHDLSRDPSKCQFILSLELVQENAKLYAEIEKEHSSSPVNPVECWGASQEASTPYSVQQLQPLQEE